MTAIYKFEGLPSLDAVTWTGGRFGDGTEMAVGYNEAAVASASRAFSLSMPKTAADRCGCLLASRVALWITDERWDARRGVTAAEKKRKRGNVINLDAIKVDAWRRIE